MTHIKKHIYVRPAMRVVKLSHRLHLLAGSGDPAKKVSIYRGSGGLEDPETEDQW